MRKMHSALGGYIRARDLFNETINDFHWMKQNNQEISAYNQTRLRNTIRNMRMYRALVAKLTSQLQA